MYYKSAWSNFCLHVILRWWYRKIESISRSLENASSSNLRLLKSLYFSDSPPPLGLLGRKFLLHRMYRTHSLMMAVELFLSLLEHCTCPFCLGWGGNWPEYKSARYNFCLHITYLTGTNSQLYRFFSIPFTRFMFHSVVFRGLESMATSTAKSIYLGLKTKIEYTMGMAFPNF